MTTRIISKLRDYQRRDSKIIEEIIAYILVHYPSDEEVTRFLRDLLAKGCESGMVKGMGAHAGAHDFFERHYGEIEHLRFNFQTGHGKLLEIPFDLKTHMAWFAYEERARHLAWDLDIGF